MKCHVGYYWDALTDGGTFRGNSYLLFFCKFMKDGSLSDTAVSSIDPVDRQRHPRHESSRGRGGATATGNAAAGNSAGMGKKSNSTSQLSAAGNDVQ